MKTADGKPPSRRWIRERRRAIEAKFDNFAVNEDEDGLRYWLTYDAELDEGSSEFQAALDAYRERVAQIQAHRLQKRQRKGAR